MSSLWVSSLGIQGGGPSSRAAKGARQAAAHRPASADYIAAYCGLLRLIAAYYRPASADRGRTPPRGV